MPTALISVSNKDGIVEFADGLVNMEWTIFASGGTAGVLRAGDIPVRDVAEIAGPELLGGLVKTISPELSAGLMCPPDRKEELSLPMVREIPFIDLLCCDLYDLAQATQNPRATEESVKEFTDIGGVLLLRAAAKGRRIVICDPADRMPVLDWMRKGESKGKGTRRRMAAKAEFVSAQYCLTSARYLSNGDYDGILGKKVRDCCYGENKWQSPAALFMCDTDDPLVLHEFKLLEGNLPSYTNDRDLGFRELHTITHIAAAMDKNFGHVPHIAVGVKHGNPCGAAVGTTPEATTERMIMGNPLSIFGGMIITNFRITPGVVALLPKAGKEEKRMIDGLAAPGFDEDAIEMLSRRKDGRCRLYQNSALAELGSESLDTSPLFMPVRGGFLRQPNYTYVLDLKNPELTEAGFRVPDQTDLLLAWAVGSTSNSNTVTLVKDHMVIGNGVGQQDRVGACELAVKRVRDAGHNTRGAIAYSDSFFPFPDGVAVLADAGIMAILTTSGSVNDDKVQKYCAEKGVSLIQISDDLSRGFFGH